MSDSALPHISGQAIAVVLMILWPLVAKLAGAGKSKDTAPSPADDQTRRVQEEIRRKILQRRGESPAQGRPLPPPLVAPRPIANPIPETLREILDARLKAREEADRKTWQVAAATPPPPAIQDAAPVVLPATPSPRAPEKELTGSQVTASVRGDLRDPQALRRAFILREILSPPVALR